MKVRIDNIRFYSIDEIRDRLKKALKNDKGDFEGEEKDGFEWAEHRVMLCLQELESENP